MFHLLRDCCCCGRAHSANHVHGDLIIRTITITTIITVNNKNNKNNNNNDHSVRREHDDHKSRRVHDLCYYYCYY